MERRAGNDGRALETAPPAPGRGGAERRGADALPARRRGRATQEQSVLAVAAALFVVFSLFAAVH